MTRNLCVICDIRSAILICVYCPLQLFCSPTCAHRGNDHACILASKLARDLSISSDDWYMSAQSLKYLDHLFLFPIPRRTCTLLLEHRVCFSANALIYLSAWVDFSYVWPHEQKEHELWLRSTARLINSQWSGPVPASLLYEWAKNPVTFFPLLSVFGSWKHTANAVLPLLDHTKISDLIITTKSGVYQMLLTLIAVADIPALYHTFHAIIAMQLTRDNIPFLFFPDQRGRHILLPTLNEKTWERAMLTVPVFPYILSRHKNRWLRGKQEYLFFEKRKNDILELFITRNPYFAPAITNLPPLQAWTFDV